MNDSSKDANTLQGSSNAEYHANRTHLSSSQLKLLLKDPKEFHRLYILGEPEVREEKAAFTEGSFVHTLILEPHKVTTDYAVFPGLRRAGAAYEEFKKEAGSKTIITVPQVARCERLFQAFQKHPMAVELISRGNAEESYVAEIQGVACKARMDYIVPNSYIVDVKTTSMPSDKDLFSNTVREYGYDLSAALYKAIADKSLSNFGVEYGHMSATALITLAQHDFYWLVLSKTDFQCHVYKASAKTMAIGTAQVAKALTLYNSCKMSGNWALEQPLVLPPLQWEIEEV